MNLKSKFMTALLGIFLTTCAPAYAGSASPFPADKQLPEWEGSGAYIWCQDSQSVDNFLDSMPQVQEIFNQIGQFVAPGCILVPSGVLFSEAPVAEYLYTSNDGTVFVVISMETPDGSVWTFAQESLLEEKQTF